jgi:hypothetical protein
MKTVVIMPGGFHPFHAGHAALYQSAVQAFPNADVYVAATNDTKTRPFPFEIKEKLAKVAGVQDGRFVQVTSPFQSKEILQNYNPDEDAVVFVRSEKDRDQQPKPGGTKKDGSPAYFQPYTGKDMQPFGKHGYMAYLPTVEFGPGIKSATEIRNMWPQLNDRRKLAMVMSLYPKAQENQKLAQNIVKMLDLGMGIEEQVNEYNIRKTKKFIQRAHDKEQGQMYGNMPYSSHPKQVANLGKKFFGGRFNDEAVKVALLHDVLEDTPYTPGQLAKKGFSKEVIEAVQLLTKNKTLSYADNIRNIIDSGNPLAMMVKYCDNYMNYTGDKSHWDSDKAAASQKKYLASLNMLGDVLSIKKHIGDKDVVSEAAGRVYSERQADITNDLGDGYFLGDDSYNDDEGFTKAGYSVYKQVGEDSFRLVGSVNMSPYRNPPGHVQASIKKLIDADQNNVTTDGTVQEDSMVPNDQEMDIKFKTISPKDKLVYLNGKKIGMVFKGGEKFAGFNEYRKHSDWTGNITIGGKELSIGRTEKASELKSKIARIIRSHHISNQDTNNVSESADYLEEK